VKPYYQDESVALYLGDCRELAPALGITADAVFADPPYGETSLEWDNWPPGWPKVAEAIAPQLWCFGSMRMFMEQREQLSSWKLAQDVVWEKHNGSSFHNDRFRRVHELALHFYRGDWASLHRDVPRVGEEQRRQNIRRGKTPHLGTNGAASVIEGQRMQSSVIYAASCHGFAVNETQKPEEIVAPLVQYSVPPGGLLVSLFAGSGTDLVVARKTGRRAIGFELRESQCEKAAQRLSQRELEPA
jgi:site-specific DNA-methyltransferase (adenine-specific)